MMAKKHGKLRSQFRYKGYYCDVSADTQEALEARIERKKKQIDDRYILNTDITVGKWVQIWLVTYKEPHVTSTTLADYKAILKKLDLSMPISEVKPIHLQVVLNRLSGRSNSMIRKFCVLTKSMFEDAVDNGLIEKNPAKKLQKPKGVTHPRRSLTNDERELIERTLPKSEAGSYIALMLYAGCRPSEAGRVQGIDVDKESRRLHIRGTKSTAADRYVPITDKLYPFLQQLAPDQYAVVDSAGHRTTKTSRYTLWQKFERDLNIEAGCVCGRRHKHSPHDLPLEDLLAPDLVPYLLRHTFCTDLEAAGVPINVARDFMGHASIDITSKIYTHRSDVAFSDAAKKMNAY